jgi:hypothetical protein
MDSRVQLAWLGWVARAAAQNLNPFEITENTFRYLITNAIRFPNNIMDAMQVSKRSSVVHVLISLHLLSHSRTLCLSLPLWVLLFLMVPFCQVAFFIGMLPVSVHTQMVARNHQTIEPALTDTATHAQAPTALACPPADPMQLSHLNESEEAGAPEPVAVAGVARATEQLLNAIAQRITTPVCPQAATDAAG